MKQILIFIAIIVLALGAVAFGNVQSNGQIDAMNAENEQLVSQNQELTLANQALEAETNSTQVELQDVQGLINEFLSLQTTIDSDFVRIQDLGQKYANGDVTKFDEYMNSIQDIVEHDQAYVDLIQANQKTLDEFGMDTEHVISRTNRYISTWEITLDHLQNTQA